MHIRIFMMQLRRGKKRTGLYILLLTVVVMFFVMSVNLYYNSRNNLKEVEENYSTLAIMELYGEVNQYGELVEPYSETHKGYKSVAVEGYDISQIVAADGVIGWDLRSKYAAYIENEPAMWDKNTTIADFDTIRFEIMGQESIELPIAWDTRFVTSIPFDIKLRIIDSAAGCFQYSNNFTFDGVLVWQDEEKYIEQVKKLNRSENTDKIILYPGVEYIATNRSGADWMLNDEGMLEIDYSAIGSWGSNFDPENSTYSFVQPVVAYGSTEYISSKVFSTAENDPLPIQRWEDVQNDPILKEYFDGVWKATPINLHTYCIELSNDVSSVPVFHLGGAALSSGRLITEEEYENGAKVCMVSEQTANLQGWSVGDKLNLHFYEFEAMISSNDEWGSAQPFWHRDTEGFFDEGEYEIVGIYTQNPITGNSDIARSTLAMPWYTIYIPENSVKVPIEVKDKKVHGALLSIRLENGSIDRFMDNMNELGLTEEKEGQYNPKFTFYDQGYSVIQPGLEAMISTSKLLLVLSSILLIVTCVMMAFFFVQNQKQNIGIFRMLGGTKGKTLRAVLACSLVIMLIGILLGSIFGYHLTQYVGESILAENQLKSEQAASYQAYVVRSNEKVQSLSVNADMELVALASSAALLFPMLTVGFTMHYIHREPRELLPKSGG